MKIEKILQGDCLEVLKTLPENSVDSIVTDPPYELGFMGKSWDNTGIANNKEMWAECLRVLKPGGHLLSFGGTRTYHRMASAIEDAGFEVRDMIEWCYGSGFPKSLNISKKLEGVTGKQAKGFNTAGGKENFEKQDKSFRSDYGYIWKPTNENAKQWEGWGTALKPAHEPICMARKPLAEKTVAENCLKYGTGGINIDESRVETSEELNYGTGKKSNVGFKTSPQNNERPIYDGMGRFPANLIHDNSEEVRECFPETKSQSGGNRGKTQIWGKTDGEQERNGFDDSGNASRFFKSIKQDNICSLCCLPFNDEYDTMSVCNNTNVNNVGQSSGTIQAITESTVLKNATGKVNERLVQNVRSVGNLCDLCGTYIAQRLAEPKKAQDQELTLGKVFISEPKLQILQQCLASFVELRGNTDTIPTTQNLNLLFGYVLNAIDNYTLNCEVENEKENNPTQRSLLYKAKASKSERNKGCEGLEEKEATKFDGGDFQRGEGNNAKEQTHKNNHPTVKPIALMEYLIKMVTPESGIVLDPFAGSGSTLVAAKQNGFQYIGIELTPEYIPIIEARLKSPISQKLF